MTKASDISFMTLALEQSQIAFDKGEVPIGAVLIQNEKVIAANYNQIESLKDASAHAEMLVIREASKKLDKWRLEECELYVTVEPCPMCLGAIRLSRIKRLIVGTLESRMGALTNHTTILSDPNLGPIPQITKEVMKEECSLLMKTFFSKLRK